MQNRAGQGGSYSLILILHIFPFNEQYYIFIGKQGKNEDIRSARKAKTEYYILKKKILAAKSDEIELQNKKLKLEIEALKQKNNILKKIKPIKLLKSLYS